MAAESLDAVVAAGKNYGPVLRHVKIITDGSALGDLMFGYIYGQLNAGQLKSHIQKCLTSLETKGLDAAKLSKFTAETLEGIADFEHNSALMKKRLIEVPLWGVDIPITVHSPRVEFDYRCKAHLKANALGRKDGLALLVFESWCFPHGELPDQSCEISSELLKDFRAAREIASEVLSPATIACIEDIPRLLSGASEALVTLDKSFILEIGFVQTALSAAMATGIETRCLSLLPTVTWQPSILEALHSMTSLRESQLVMVADRKSQDTIDGVVECLTALSKSSAPPASLMNGGEFWDKVSARLQYFFRFSPKLDDQGKACAPGSFLVGKSALRSMLGESEALSKSDSTKVTFNKLDAPQAYRWLLSEQERKVLDGLVQSCLGTTKRPESGGAASSNPEQKKKKKSGGESARAGVVKFF